MMMMLRIRIHVCLLPPPPRMEVQESSITAAYIST